MVVDPGDWHLAQMKAKEQLLQTQLDLATEPADQARIRKELKDLKRHTYWEVAKARVKSIIAPH